MQNITLYIGDNASGKTRLLKKIIKEAKLNHKEVVTNIKELGFDAYAIDKNKYDLVKQTPNELVDEILIKNNIDTMHTALIYKILGYTYAQGDILVLDEIDSTLSSQEITYISMVLSEIRHKWEHIYVNGYSERLLRMFTTIDYENYVEKHESNIYYVTDNMNTIKIEESEAIEYIDTIRG